MAGMVTARAWQTVRPHVPLIKFRKGGIPRDDPRSSGSSGSSGSTASPVTAQAKNVNAAARPTLEDYQLPPRYRRQAISEEEIAYINRGGPD